MLIGLLIDRNLDELYRAGNPELDSTSNSAGQKDTEVVDPFFITSLNGSLCHVIFSFEAPVVWEAENRKPQRKLS